MTKRQQAAAERRRDQRFQIEWDTTDVWRVLGKDDQVYEYPIPEMDNRHLWQTINWCVRTSQELFAQYRDGVPSAAVAAYVWLRDRPLFRALLMEAVGRDFTFPKDVFNYLKQYVLDRSGNLPGYTPWRDPSKAEQQPVLKQFLDESLLPPEVEHGKEFRAIDIE